MSRTRWRAEAVLAALFGIVIIAIASGGALWFFSAAPVHPDPASVPSAEGAHVERYSNAIEEGRRLARALLVAENVPGLSVAVAAGGDIVWSESFGWIDVEERAPVTPRSRFRLGAASKPLTAAAAALLHDRGRVDLDAPVQTYVAGYPPKQWPVSTRQLLGDVAGVHRIRGDNNAAMPTAHCGRLDEAVALLADDPLLFQPGTQHRYSIWGWVLVSAVVEGAARQPFPRFMAREVFEPLAMERTVVEETDDLDGVAHRGRRPDYSCVAGGGAFLSTPTDLVRFGSAMLKPGFLKEETIATMQAPLRLESGESTNYALGWKVESIPLAGKPARLVAHRGRPMSGAVSLLTFPDLGIVVAAAANAGAPGLDSFAQTLAEVFVSGVAHAGTRHDERARDVRRRLTP